MDATEKQFIVFFSMQMLLGAKKQRKPVGKDKKKQNKDNTKLTTSYSSRESFPCCRADEFP
jgi:hypothetical protein